jgi:acyl-CoA synthetase (AMP-forming)/AMP-acid ligase II
MADPGTIASQLSAAASQHPGLACVISRRKHLTFRGLEEQSNRCAYGLRQHGVDKGTRVVMLFKPGIEFMVLSFALIKLGAIAVFVDPRMGRENLNRSLAAVRFDAFVGSLPAHMARVAFAWGRGAVKLCINVGTIRVPGVLNYEEVMRGGQAAQAHSAAVDPDCAAAIVFTSGSTGVPKGVVYTHRMFSAQVACLAEQFEIQPGEVDLTTFPLFALFNPALRMTSVFPDIDFTRPGMANANTLVECIRTHNATHMFGSPALLERLAKFGQQRGVMLPSVRRVLVAGAPVSMKTLVALRTLLGPGAEIYSCYGATEALPICSISSRELLAETEAHPEKGACLGRPICGVNVKIVKVVDAAMPTWSDDLLVTPGEVGELAVGGPNVSRTYWNQSANELTKIRAANDTVLHRMGDLGYIDERGTVWFCGRKSQRVVTSSETLYTAPCERVFDQHPSVRRSALVGVGKPPNRRPVLCVELENGSSRRDLAKIKHELLTMAQRHPTLRQIDTILFRSDFPVDARHNAKIIREELSIWAAKRIS